MSAGSSHQARSMGRGFEEVRERDMWLRHGHVQLRRGEGQGECRAEGAISGRTAGQERAQAACALAGSLVLVDAMSQSSSDRDWEVPSSMA